ncbi:hypothetical protein [Streptomyces caelestis]|uniref:hypothetical protein n=1 Tax=Streptomyces caelestis TaxID=36816 RepID=UPI00364F8A2C
MKNSDEGAGPTTGAGPTRVRGTRWTGTPEKGLWELRENLKSRIGELEAQFRAKVERGQIGREEQALADQAHEELRAARNTLSHNHRRRLPAAHSAVAQTHFDVAHNLLLRVASMDEITSMMPDLVAFIREHLPVDDAPRVQVEEIALSVRSGTPLQTAQREVVVDSVAVARQAHLRERLRVRRSLPADPSPTKPATTWSPSHSLSSRPAGLAAIARAGPFRSTSSLSSAREAPGACRIATRC